MMFVICLGQYPEIEVVVVIACVVVETTAGVVFLCAAVVELAAWVQPVVVVDCSST